MKKIWKLIISLLIPVLAGAIGSLFTSASVSVWYPTLNKPFFNPPSWVFGPVWTMLYIMIGIALYLVWIKENKKEAFIAFGAQMFLNSLWSILFFGLKSPGFALIEIILLYRIRKASAYLMIPYILWVSFAALLNFMIWFLN